MTLLTFWREQGDEGLQQDAAYLGFGTHGQPVEYQDSFTDSSVRYTSTDQTRTVEYVPNDDLD